MSLRMPRSPPSPYAICRLTSKVPSGIAHPQTPCFAPRAHLIRIFTWTDLVQMRQVHKDMSSSLQSFILLSLPNSCHLQHSHRIQCLLNIFILTGASNSCNVQPLHPFHHPPYPRRSRFVLDGHAIRVAMTTGTWHESTLEFGTAALSMQQVSDMRIPRILMAFSQNFFSFSYPTPAGAPDFISS